MTFAHAVVWLDHVAAQLHQFNAEQVVTQNVHAHVHPTAQHGSAVRSEHEFAGAVCNAIDGIGEVLVTGSHTALADFRRYAEKHRPLTAKRVAAYEVVGHPSDKQLVARGREFFDQRNRQEQRKSPSGF